MPFARASASIPADWSMPTTRRPAAATSGKYLPVPHGASRTTPPGGHVVKEPSDEPSLGLDRVLVLLVVAASASYSATVAARRSASHARRSIARPSLHPAPRIAILHAQDPVHRAIPAAGAQIDVRRSSRTGTPAATRADRREATLREERTDGVPRRGHEAAGRPPVRGRRGRPRGDRGDRPARPADAVGRLQPGPAAGRRDRPGGPAPRGPDLRRGGVRGPGMGPWISECAAQFVPCVSEEIYHRRYQEPDKVDDEGREIDWPVPYWFVDIGATTMVIMLAAVDAGLASGFAGAFDPDAAAGRAGHPRRVRPDRGHAGRPAAAGRPLALAEARLGPLRGVRPLRALGARPA